MKFPPPAHDEAARALRRAVVTHPYFTGIIPLGLLPMPSTATVPGTRASALHLYEDYVYLKEAFFLSLALSS